MSSDVVNTGKSSGVSTVTVLRLLFLDKSDADGVSGGVRGIMTAFFTEFGVLAGSAEGEGKGSP